MPGLISVIVEIFNAFTNQPENVEAQGIELTDGYTYFTVDKQYRKNPYGDIEVYYPSQERWAIYSYGDGTSPSPTPSENPINNGTYTPGEINAAVSGGSGVAPTPALEEAIKLAISIANNNLYGYNWNGGNYANYQGRCGGWYAYLHNEQVSLNNPDYVAGDFDCSSFVAFVLWKVGIFPGQMSAWFNTVTDNLDARLRNNGFQRFVIASTPNLQMQRGDILLRQSGSRQAGTYSGHTALCIGSGEIVHAKNNAFGDLSNTALQNKYKERGDYLGHELCTQPDSLNNWIWLYRWTG